MRDIQNEAAYLREALRLGAACVGDVVSWSDSVIAESAVPDDAFIEISSMHKAHPLDVLHVLESLSEHVSTIEVLPSVLGLAHEKLVVNPSYGRALAKALYGIYVKCDYNVPDELRDIGWFDDAFDLGAQGTYGSVENALEELLQFTKRFAEDAKNRFKPI